MNRRHFVFALSATALLLTGCATQERHSHSETRLSTPPPAPRVEEIPVAPNAESYWIPGHWKSNGSSYVWARGHWEQPRQSMVYQQAYWSESGGYWRYHPGRWVSIDAPASEAAPQVVSVAPPAPQVDVVTAPPSPTHIWISGYWRWNRGRYAWAPGHWAGARAGYFWAPGHWVRRGSRWHFSGGFWQRY